MPFRIPIPLLTVLALGLAACETDITVDLPQPEDRIVVEGSIEPGQPPLVLLTRNAPFFGSFDLNQLASFFVRDADVSLDDGTATAALIELCLSDLPPEFLPLAEDLLGVDPDSLLASGQDFCLYTIDPFGGAPMLGVPGRTYRLTVVSGADTLRATSRMEQPVAPDSLWWEPHPDPAADSLVRLNLRFTDPDTLGNQYRYWTRRSNARLDESEPFYPGVASIIDDLLFNGQTIDFSLDRGQPRSAGFDFETYGFFWKDDTIVLRLAQVDRGVFNFWNTLEYDAGSGGPFGSATVIASNVQGGLGVFAAYGSAYDTLVVR